MTAPRIEGGATSFMGFIATVVFGLAFGLGFFIASNVLAWIASLLAR
jgi:hypothetical protein